MTPALLAELNRERAARRAVVVETNLACGRSRLVRDADADAEPSSEAIRTALATGRSGPSSRDSGLFLRPYLPSPRLTVIGAVHISQALAPMAVASGFDVRIIDPRQAFATPERFPNVAVEAEWPEPALARAPLDPWTALVVLSHDPKIDDEPLVAGLREGCFYVGALGSRKTHARRLERLQERGLPLHVLSRIEAPIGLDIGAASPSEIAVAILGSVIRALRRRGGPAR